MEAEIKSVVHIIDDDPGMRKSLLMLADSASLTARAYASAEEFLEVTDGEPAHPGCLVLDMRMPGMGGIELLQKMRTDMNDIPVVLISAHADVPATVRGMKLGAVDLLQKPVEPDTLVAAIKRSLEISRSLHQQREESASMHQRFENLTARELELLGFVVDGHSNKQIAVDMGIAIKTVANHRASLMQKTGASNAADLARIYTIYKTKMAGSNNSGMGKNTQN